MRRSPCFFSASIRSAFEQLFGNTNLQYLNAYKKKIFRSKYFSGNQENMPSAKQLTTIYPALSDHCAFKVGDTLVLNMMMQNRSHIDRKTGQTICNNAFNQSETDIEYQARVSHSMSVLVHILKNFPDIEKIALQEAPIKPADIEIMADYFEKFLPEWQFAHFDMTDFSVTSIIRTNDKKPQFYTDSALHYGSFNQRCQTFTKGDGYKWSNIHATHSDVETCLTHIFEKILDDMMIDNVTRHDIAGDFNASGEVISRILSKVWDEKCADAAKKNLHDQPCLLEPIFVPSRKGHQKSNGAVIDADGVLSLRLKPASQYGFHFQTKHLGLFALLFGAGPLLFDSLTAENAAVAGETTVSQLSM